MKCLLLYDIQNDFFQNGSMNVPKTVEFIVQVNRLISLKGKLFDAVVATQDYHPPQHQCFASNNPGKKQGEKMDLHGSRQTLWPDHCVQNSPGASFHPALEVHRLDYVVKKGQNHLFDTHSGFYDNGKNETTKLNDFLKFKKITDIYLLGLGLDLGVYQTAVDARELGYNVFLISDLCPSYKWDKEFENAKLEDLKTKNVTLIKSSQLN